MSLMVKDKQLFKNYNKIWEKIESLMRKKFDSKPFYGNDGNDYIKTQLKTFKDSIITNFHYKKVPKEKIPYKSLSIVVLDSVIKADNKYYNKYYIHAKTNYHKKFYKTPLLSIKLEPFIMLIASSLLIYQK